MRRFGPLLAVGVAVIAGLSMNGAYAATPRLPAALYPSGAHITYRPSISNESMDCMWGFYCEGSIALFHFQSETELHRAGGGGQFAGVRAHRRMTMAFELFASRYDTGIDDNGNSWAAVAFADFCAAVQAHNYHPIRINRGLLPHGSQGAWTAQLQRSGTSDLIVMAAWTGQTEVEGIVMYDHRSSPARTVATSLLILQTRRAVRDGLPSGLPVS